MADLLILLPWGDSFPGGDPKDLHQAIYSAFEAKLRARYTVAPLGIEKQDIVAQLTAPVKPKVIIYANGSLVAKKKAWLVDLLLAYLDAGGTLLLACNFASLVNPPRFDQFVRNKLGLAWSSGHYTRETSRLLPAFKSAFQSPVPEAYSLKALHLQNVAAEARVYAPVTGIKNQTAVAFERYKGKGFIGYVGDVNNEEGSQDVVIAMLERVLNPPRSSPLAPDAPEFKPAVKTSSGTSNPAKPPPAGTTGQGSSPAQQAGVAECDMCGKPSQQRCSGCKIINYCSVDCQQFNWENHKAFCKMVQSKARKAGAAPGKDAGPRGLDRVMQGPGGLFADTSVSETIRRLVDVYRLRSMDQYNFGGDCSGLFEDLFEGRAHKVPRDHFVKFLRLAESRPGLLPAWWDAKAREICLKVALDGSGRSFIGHVVEKSDIQDAYGDSFMPMAMRIVGESIYGSPIGSGPH